MWLHVQKPFRGVEVCQLACFKGHVLYTLQWGPAPSCLCCGFIDTGKMECPNTSCPFFIHIKKYEWDFKPLDDFSCWAACPRGEGRERHTGQELLITHSLYHWNTFRLFSVPGYTNCQEASLEKQNGVQSCGKLWQPLPLDSLWTSFAEDGYKFWTHGFKAVLVKCKPFTGDLVHVWDTAPFFANTSDRHAGLYCLLNLHLLEWLHNPIPLALYWWCPLKNICSF